VLFFVFQFGNVRVSQSKYGDELKSGAVFMQCIQPRTLGLDVIIKPIAGFTTMVVEDCYCNGIRTGLFVKY